MLRAWVVLAGYRDPSGVKTLFFFLINFLPCFISLNSALSHGVSSTDRFSFETRCSVEYCVGWGNPSGKAGDSRGFSFYWRCETRTGVSTGGGGGGGMFGHLEVITI